MLGLDIFGGGVVDRTKDNAVLNLLAALVQATDTGANPLMSVCLDVLRGDPLARELLDDACFGKNLNRCGHWQCGPRIHPVRCAFDKDHDGGHSFEGELCDRRNALVALLGGAPCSKPKNHPGDCL